ncbi:TadE/TadG family type IV pilus assembly protein [Pseudomonas sp. TCU-HL1]|uniref:TadE/TadG family type IV pilus assembly protein n=1 Tax=Pseudomonas sp. TCU-HL1 TaxID=1856685 RepID=UPI00083E1C88|nr:TadE/TadG family type IV pilus assembly protein [Pseudomonas sp. TCU-HL1]AOE84480.1 pilus assembly protein TadG [Pseudomonas sp. TCU-HL1]
MGPHAGKGPQGQRGVAMVEFTIALPLLLLLLLAIGEFGRLLFQYNSLLQANRDAVRYVAGKAWNRTLGQVDLSAGLQAETKNLAVYGVPVAQTGAQPVVPGLTTANVQVSAVAGTTDHVQVSISYSFQPLIGSGIPALVGSQVRLDFPLVATSVMRAL